MSQYSVHDAYLNVADHDTKEADSKSEDPSIRPLSLESKMGTAMGGTASPMSTATPKPSAARRARRGSVAMLQRAKSLAQMAFQQPKKATKRKTIVEPVMTEEMHTSVFGRDVKAVMLQERQTKIVEPFMLHPHSPFVRWWNLVTIALIVMLVFWVPFALGFNYEPSCSGTADQAWWCFFDGFTDVFFAIDLLLNFRTAYLDDGELVQKPCRVAKHYVRTWFVFDLLATLPFDRFIIASVDAGRSATFAKIPRFLRLVRLVRLMRLFRMFKLRRLLDQYNNLSHVTGPVSRVLSIFLWLLVVAHILGCGWYFVADINDLSMDTWAGAMNFGHESLWHRYTVAVYWAFVTVTTVGYGDIYPVNVVEQRFVIVCTLVGNCVFAYMIGKMTSLATHIDAKTLQFQNKMTAVNDFMQHHNLPRSVRERIRAYYEAFWARSVYYSEETILGELSFSLRREVDMMLKREIIESVPFFKGADNNFIAELISRLQLVHAQADDYIIRMGEVGHHMYLLKRGEVLVLDAQGRPSHHLGEGSFFGEVTLLDPTLRRTSSIRAVTMCELYALSKPDFDDVIELYPELGTALIAIAESRLARSAEAGDLPEAPNLITLQEIVGAGAESNPLSVKSPTDGSAKHSVQSNNSSGNAPRSSFSLPNSLMTQASLTSEDPDGPKQHASLFASDAMSAMTTPKPSSNTTAGRRRRRSSVAEHLASASPSHATAAAAASVSPMVAVARRRRGSVAQRMAPPTSGLMMPANGTAASPGGGAGSSPGAYAAAGSPNMHSANMQPSQHDDDASSHPGTHHLALPAAGALARRSNAGSNMLTPMPTADVIAAATAAAGEGAGAAPAASTVGFVSMPLAMARPVPPTPGVQAAHRRFWGRTYDTTVARPTSAKKGSSNKGGLRHVHLFNSSTPPLPEGSSPLLNAARMSKQTSTASDHGVLPADFAEATTGLQAKHNPKSLYRATKGIIAARRLLTSKKSRVRMAAAEQQGSAAEYAEMRRQFKRSFVDPKPADWSSHPHRSQNQRLDLLELMMLDMVSKMDYMMANMGLMHPLHMKQNLPGENLGPADDVDYDSDDSDTHDTGASRL